MPAPAIAEKTYCLDVEYQGVPRLIACGAIETAAGLLLVDPGPTASLDTLRAALADHGATLADVHALLLTHIHLDHAGATGTIVEAAPHVQVYVHARGARHLVRPERLLASAARLYGDQMDALWGAFLPTPEANVHALDGGETLRIGGRRFAVAYTPGHAVHHVSYLDEATGTAFAGDTAGMRVAGVDFIVPVAPPPDVDLPAWHRSLGVLRAWRPARLFLTHFGASESAEAHLATMAEKLDAWAEAVRRSLEDAADDADRAAAFHADRMAVMRAHIPEADRLPYEHFGQPRASWHGLARYWRKQARRGAEAMGDGDAPNH
ncbi:MAG: MBL fold metallo-hydrolase [Rhodothermales bacterium]|nr:MBL fold metallo-hydrolase [Rhodothermales bacterium]